MSRIYRALFNRFISPLYPRLTCMAREEFKVGPGRARFNDVVEFIRFSGVLPFPGRDDVCLRAACTKSTHVPANSKKDEFCDISEVETHTPSIRTAVFPNLVPNHVRLVGEPPPLHHFKAFRDKGIGNPQIEMGLSRRKAVNREFENLLQCHRWVTQKALMFGGHFPGAIRKSPRRVCKNGRERPLDSGEKILRGGCLGNVKYLRHKASFGFQKPGGGSRRLHPLEREEEASTCVWWKLHRNPRDRENRRSPATHHIE